MKQGTKPKYSIWQSVCFMVKTAWHKQKGVLFFCLILVTLETGVNLTQLFMGPNILARVESLAPLEELAATIALFSLGLFFLTGLRGYIDENVIFGQISVREEILNALNYKACVTSYPNTRNPSITKLQQAAMDATAGNSQPTEHIWKTLTSLFTNLTGFVVYSLLLSGLNGFLLALVLGTTVAGFLVSKRIHEWEYRHKDEKEQYRKALSYMRRKAESITLAKDIRIFHLKPWLEAVFASTLGLLEAFVNRREKRYLWASLLDVALSFARNGIAYFYLIRLTVTQGLPASEFLLYFTAVSGFTAWVTGILTDFSTLHRECLGLSVVQEYLNLPEPFRFQGGKPIPNASRWELRMEHVSFRYPGAPQDTLHNFNLTIHPGEKLAIVGLNGAGKTTVVKLLCGFYDPDEGRVLLNGTDIRQWNRQEYYSLLSAVFQDFSMLDITVAESVAQSVDRIDRQRVVQCLEKAGLMGLVEQFPQGLDTHIGRTVYLDGVLMSGGEFQRLMLARALYKNGPILVLDEPTAALDPIAENDIYMKYHEMTAGKTSVFISHRLASTRFCDRIILIDHGRIAEEGTHEDLMKRNGLYAKLFEVQSRYYQEGRQWNEEET